MAEALLKAMEASDTIGASEEFKREIDRGRDPWEIHLSLFPVVQRVLNPPFVNAHLPKMYNICRDLVPYLSREEIQALVELEINEYARKPLMEKLPRRENLAFSVSFTDVESAIREQDPEKTATLLATFHEQKGGKELCRRFLLLGSGYLGDSLGHSVSSPAFILSEMMERNDQDPWPALVTLSVFFCKSRFHTTPSFRESTEFKDDQALDGQMLRATGGKGIINMHDTITRYAIERARRFFNEEEFNHMTMAWIEFMGQGEKGVDSLGSFDPHNDIHHSNGPALGYSRFYEIFSRREAKSVVAALSEMISPEEGRRQLGRFLIKGLCTLYQGSYDPHYLTGLGSALWAVERYWDQPSIAQNALFQYLDFYFDSLRSRNSG